MPRDITDVSTFTDPALTVSSGDSASATNMLDVLQPLANRTRYLKDGLAASLQLINVVNYGGVGDGVTDNTTAFVNASSAASSDPSRTVYMPAGTYKLSSNQTIAGNLHFAPEAMLKPAAGQTITLTGQITAGDYQQIFDTSLGGKFILSATKEIPVCWFGADPTHTNPSAIHFRSAIATAKASQQGTGLGLVLPIVTAPAGKFVMEKPVILESNFQALIGNGYDSTNLDARTFVGPAVLCSNTPLFTTHAADYAGGNTVTLGDGACIVPTRYGSAWFLDGRAGFSLDMIIAVTATQANTNVILASAGNQPDNTLNTAFAIYALALDFGYSNTNLGLRFDLTTVNGKVSATTAAGAILTNGTWYNLRFDYDGSNLRVFVNGVAQTLATSGTTIAQTGVMAQSPTEAVLIGDGLSAYFDYQGTVINCPTGMKCASLRLAHASRGSSNYSPPVAKFTEDGSTRFLINWDTLDAVGSTGVYFARAWGGTDFGLMDAWLPNDSNNSGSYQIGPVRVEEMQIECFNGPAVDCNATPNIKLRRIHAIAQSGFLLNNNGYNSTVEECHATESANGDVFGGRGTGLRFGNASNFVVIRDCQMLGFDASLAINGQVCLEGFNYFISPRYCGVHAHQAFLSNFGGSLFISDEASPYHCKYGMILNGAGSVTCTGTLFGLVNYTDQLQVWVNNTVGSITPDNATQVKFVGCSFTGNPAGANPVRVSNINALSTVEIDSCDGEKPTSEFTVDSDCLARVGDVQKENKQLSITLSDANTTLDINQWLYGKLVFSGTLTADRNIVVPTIGNYTREIQNTTTFALLVKTASGTGIYVPPGLTCSVSCDGTNVILDWQSDAPLRVISSGSSSTAKDWDQIISLKVAGTYNLTTPANPKKGQPLVVKDQQGDAGTNTKTVTANSGQTIDGATTATITTNFGRVSLVFDGISDWMS